MQNKWFNFSKSVLLDNYTDSEFKDADFNGELRLKEKIVHFVILKEESQFTRFFSINYISMQPCIVNRLYL
jgi:hypothetical protein